MLTAIIIRIINSMIKPLVLKPLNSNSYIFVLLKLNDIILISQIYLYFPDKQMPNMYLTVMYFLIQQDLFRLIQDISQT